MTPSLWIHSVSTTDRVGCVLRGISVSLFWLLCPVVEAQQGTASWYSINSAIREGTCTDAAHRRCLMANGRKLDDDAFTAASWDFPFGTALHVCAQHPLQVSQVDKARRAYPDRSNARCVEVVVTDRGPTKRLYRQGRIIDLSQKAFEALAPLTSGVIAVTVERIR